MTDPGYYNEANCHIDEFRKHIDQQTSAEDLKYAVDIQDNIPIYRIPELIDQLSSEQRLAILSEWARILKSGPGVLILADMIPDTDIIDQANTIFHHIIDAEAQATKGKGDHFAATGSNARIWNSHQKLCLAAPEIFARYFGNTAMSAILEAWLGPAYQVTTQVNLVYPGGAAQQAHRDYHLGFQSSERMQAYPVHVHSLSSALTLQGAVAHCDMPVESGPTKLLPFSQTFGPGYLAMKRPEFLQLFEERYVQPPLAKGDSLFFNPALYHAAGKNISGKIKRMANLIQASSAFGRAMESLDRERMSLALYPVLQRLQEAMGTANVSAAIAACAEGYPFPTNLDSDPPLSGMAPESQAEIMQRCLFGNHTMEQFAKALRQLSSRRLP